MPRQLGNDLKLGEIIGTEQPLVMPSASRDKHLFVAGGTGVGKSKFLEGLIRQDITNHRDSGCGLLLIDPHGLVYDGLMNWLAYNNLNRPLIPIDLRRDDWVVAYNLLRQRSLANPAVIVDDLVQAMAYVWGASGTDDTPLFARWATGTLRALYEKRLTLVEALDLTDREAPALRRTLTAGLNDPVTRRFWANVNGLSPRDFDTQVASTVNRLQRFVGNPNMQNMFGQTEVSLDLGGALEEGAIILVCLAREKAQLSNENANLFATLLLSDLWTAAQERGKQKGLRPFYVYLDEFQRFVTPTMAENLAEARGFGLALTLAQQFPRQLLSSGPAGERLFDEVLENASTKVIFRLQNPENLKPLASTLFMGAFDPNEVKQEMYSTKVLGHREEVREDRTYGRSVTEGDVKTTSHAEGEGEGGPADRELASWNRHMIDAASDGFSRMATTSESRTIRSTLIPILGKELSSREFRSLDEQLFLAMQKLFVQPDRHCAVRMVGARAPVFLRTFDVNDQAVNAGRRDKYLERRFARWPFFLRAPDAVKRLAERQQKLLAQPLETPVAGEPTTARRRVKRS